MSFRYSRMWLPEFCILMPFCCMSIVMFDIFALLPVMWRAGWFCASELSVKLPSLTLSCVMFTGMPDVQFIVVESFSSPVSVIVFVMSRHSVYVFLKA